MELASSPAATERDWSSLPAGLLGIILELLPWSSHPSFAATCKHWRSAVSPFYPAWLTPVLLNSVDDVGSSSIRYYSPYYHKNFDTVVYLESPNAQVCCANGHRLALCQRLDGGETRVVDVNLVTGVIKDLHQSGRTQFDFVIYDGGRKAMFGIDALHTLNIARANQSNNGKWQRWNFSEPNHNDPTLTASPVTNPVLHRGLLYLLGINGRLAVYDDTRQEEGLQVLDEPEGFGIECDDCYLFESDEGELMAVLFCSRRSPVHIVKLNEQSMEWEKVESLEGRALFTGSPTTMMVKTNVKWTKKKNRIFVPRLYHWPETVDADLVDRQGELAFVPVSTAAVQDGAACGSSIWTCGLGRNESSEFWETTKLDYSIWVDFRN